MRKNAITAAIARLGGRGTGTKKLATLLDVTTARVYQLATVGIVPHAEQALTLSRETGIPFEDFLIPKKGKPAGDPNGSGKGRRANKGPKASAPLAAVSDSSAGATEKVVPISPGLCLGSRLGRCVRPDAKGKRTPRPDSTRACTSRSKSAESLAA